MVSGSSGRESVFDVIARHARARPDSTGVVFEDDDGTVHELSYAKLRDRALGAASALTARGVGPADHVNVHLNNCPEFYDCWFGAAAVGAVIVPTNPLLTARELAYVVEHAHCQLTVTSDDLFDVVSSAQEADRIAVPSELRGEAPDLLPHVDPADVAAVLYTSGTTSRPKGVLVTHVNYLHAGYVVAEHLRMTAADRWLIVLPLFHANAQYYSTMSALVAGGSIALMPRFSASQWAHQAARHGATLASLFAAPLRMLLAQPRWATDADNDLRAVIFSQNVTEEQLWDFERRFGAPLLQLYGMTETIAPPLLNPLDGEHRNMGVGRPTSGAKLRVLVDGELIVGGEPGVTLMAGYLDDPEATAAAIRDGWLHTGDNFRTDSDGYFYFVDRTKDMIKRAGENVAASEVEAVANAHPNVFESAAIGVPDPVRDEAIKLFVVRTEGTKLSQESLLAYCEERLAKFKVPGSIEFVDKLPRTSVGKIQKELLRRRERAN
jgi:crotonobetaine/carnitine-CoA ligase